MKICMTCKVKKKEAHFAVRKNIRKTTTVYLHSECKLCAGKRTKEWVKKNRERFNKYQNDYYHKTKSLRAKTV